MLRPLRVCQVTVLPTISSMDHCHNNKLAFLFLLTTTPQWWSELKHPCLPWLEKCSLKKPVLSVFSAVQGLGDFDLYQPAVCERRLVHGQIYSPEQCWQQTSDEPRCVFLISCWRQRCEQMPLGSLWLRVTRFVSAPARWRTLKVLLSRAVRRFFFFFSLKSRIKKKVFCRGNLQHIRYSSSGLYVVSFWLCQHALCISGFKSSRVNRCFLCPPSGLTDFKFFWRLSKTITRLKSWFSRLCECLKHETCCSLFFQ